MRSVTHIVRSILPGLLGLAVARPTLAITLPPGFSDSLVTAVGAPTALAFTPDGRLLITTQAAQRAAKRAPSSPSHASRCRTRT